MLSLKLRQPGVERRYVAGVQGTVVAKGHVQLRDVRLVLTAGGTTPSITYKAWLNPLP